MTAVVTRISESQDETMQLAAQLAARLQPGDIVALDGPLGAGKTCFVRGLAQGLGIDPIAVSSPTFIICQEYESPNTKNDRITLAHIDAYRLQGTDELETIGWDELIAAQRTIIAIEWPTRIESAIPHARRIDVALEHKGPHHRAIEITCSPDIAHRLEDFDD